MIVRRGNGRPEWEKVPGRIWAVIMSVVRFQSVFKTRKVTSFFHALVGRGFIFYLLVNVGDFLEDFIPEFDFLGSGSLLSHYRVMAAILGVGAIQKRVVVIDAQMPSGEVGESFAIRPMVYLGLTFNHRMLDSAVGDAFLGHIVNTLENWGSASI